jgi:ABC transporter substrate binding protein
MTGHIGRREFITLLGGAAASWPLAARAQQPKMLRLGFVGIQPREAPVYTNFIKRMAELGYQEGRNFTVDYIQTPDVEGYERNYRELAARNVDVFLAVGTELALRAALLAAEGKPIVLLAIDFDPVTSGYVASLSRPGGSVTGIFVRQLELAAKRVEIAREAFPRATVLGIAFDTISSEQRDAAAEAARNGGRDRLLTGKQIFTLGWSTLRILIRGCLSIRASMMRLKSYLTERRELDKKWRRFRPRLAACRSTSPVIHSEVHWHKSLPPCSGATGSRHATRSGLRESATTCSICGSSRQAAG